MTMITNSKAGMKCSQESRALSEAAILLEQSGAAVTSMVMSFSNSFQAMLMIK